MKAALVQIRVGIAFWLARHASGAPMQLGWIDEAMRSRSTFVASHGGGGNAHATEYMNVAPLPANVQLSSGISSMYERLANAEMRRRLSEKLFGRPKVGSRHKKKSKHREILQDPGDVEQKSEETEKKSTPLVPPSTTTPGLEGTTEPSGDTNPLGKQVPMNPEIGDPQAPSTSPPHEVVQGEVHPGTKMGRKLGGTPADPKKQVSGNQHVQKAPPPPRVKEASPPQQQGGGQPKQEKKKKENSFIVFFRTSGKTRSQKGGIVTLIFAMVVASVSAVGWMIKRCVVAGKSMETYRYRLRRRISASKSYTNFRNFWYHLKDKIGRCLGRQSRQNPPAPRPNLPPKNDIYSGGWSEHDCGTRHGSHIEDYWLSKHADSFDYRPEVRQWQNTDSKGPSHSLQGHERPLGARFSFEWSDPKKDRYERDRLQKGIPEDW